MHDLWGARQQLCLRPSTFYRGVLALCTRGTQHGLFNGTRETRVEVSGGATSHQIYTRLKDKLGDFVLF